MVGLPAAVYVVVVAVAAAAILIYCVWLSLFTVKKLNLMVLKQCSHLSSHPILAKSS